MFIEDDSFEWDKIMLSPENCDRQDVVNCAHVCLFQLHRLVQTCMLVFDHTFFLSIYFYYAFQLAFQM